MGYNNDQYFNLGKAGEDNRLLDTVGGNINIAADNPPFVYPNREVRVLDRFGNPQTLALKRGYIRTLTTSSNLMDVPIKKCQFQFNPQNLTQSVSQNSSMLNFLQQDPGQYAQPMMGNVNFTFDLFFDRSMEMARADFGGYNPSTSNYEQVFNELNPWEQSDPSQVGVLRDLGALYAVIGQGMAEYQMNYIGESLRQSITAEVNASDEDQAEASSKALGNIPSFLQMNLGNSAFLLPLPVRAVFSSLYIVEGLITDSTVVFTKFSTSYVPMQCAVSLTMEAKYIGFAKKNTFLTYVLEERAKMEIEQQNTETANQNETVSAFSDLVSKVNFDVDTQAGGQVRLQARFPVAQSAIDNAEDQDKVDAVSSLYDNGIISSTEISATVRAYSPFTNQSLLTASQSALASQIQQGYGNLNQVFQCAISSTDPGAKATNGKEWENMVDGSEGPWTWTSASASDITIYHYSVRIKVSQGDVVIVGTGDLYVAFEGFFDQTHTVPITWPHQLTSGQDSTAGGTVPPDSGASSVVNQQPGKSSKVGSTKADAPSRTRGPV